MFRNISMQPDTCTEGHHLGEDIHECDTKDCTNIVCEKCNVVIVVKTKLESICHDCFIQHELIEVINEGNVNGNSNAHRV